jgi:predicted secreted Zn-dependent protease
MRMNAVLRLGAWCFAVLAGSAAAYAREPKQRFYDVYGYSAQEVRRALNQFGPRDKSGKRFDAWTQWQVRWRFRYEPSNSGCYFSSIRVSLSGSVTMPQWENYADADRNLQQRWDQYISALQAHEDQHFAHGRQAAQAIEALGRNFTIRGDCESISDIFNAEAQAIVERYRQADIAFDRATRHGRTQGVRFP